LPFWKRLDDTIGILMRIGIQADVILFNIYSPSWPKGLGCLGGVNYSTYSLTHDTLYLRYIIARLASYHNVWWSMSNEWSQCSCNFQPPHTPPPPITPSSAVPAWHTPIWDALFQTVEAEDPYGHLVSIHNNAYLYNYSHPWISHFSVQHVHNKPADLWRVYGKKPFVWDEVKYEGDNTQNWGSLSAPQMVQKFWWGAATGAYVTHGESLVLPTVTCKHGTNEWSGNGGVMCGESAERIGWFRRYITNTSVRPPFDKCEGSDDGYVQALHCGTDFHLFRFYHGSPFCNASFKTVNLPLDTLYKQELVDPWRMLVSPVWCGKHPCPPLTAIATAPAPSNHAGPGVPATRNGPSALGRSAGRTDSKPMSLPPGWGSVGITVDDDSLPHILTFTKMTQPTKDQIHRAV
jgi:hypothetical protein